MICFHSRFSFTVLNQFSILNNMLPKTITNYITYLYLTGKNANLMNSATKMMLFHDVVLNAMKDQTAKIFLTLFSRRRFIHADFFLETNWTNVYRLHPLTGAQFSSLSRNFGEHLEEHRLFKQVGILHVH